MRHRHCTSIANRPEILRWVETERREVTRRAHVTTLATQPMCLCAIFDQYQSPLAPPRIDLCEGHEVTVEVCDDHRCCRACTRRRQSVHRRYTTSTIDVSHNRSQSKQRCG